MNKLDLLTIQNFFYLKVFCYNDEKKSTDLKKIFANHISRINKELSGQNSKKTNNIVRKWATDLYRHFTKDSIWIVNKRMKKIYEFIQPLRYLI